LSPPFPSLNCTTSSFGHRGKRWRARYSEVLVTQKFIARIDALEVQAKLTPTPDHFLDVGGARPAPNLQHRQSNPLKAAQIELWAAVLVHTDNWPTVHWLRPSRIAASAPPLKRGPDRLSQRRLEIKEALVQGGRIIAIEGNHLGTRLTAADDFKDVLRDPVHDGGRDSACRFTHETKLGTRAGGTLHGRVGGARIEPVLPPREAIEAFLREIIKRSLGDKQRRGCTLVNSATESAPYDPGFLGIVATFLDEVEAFFLRCVSRGKKDGSITHDHSAEDLSKSLLGILLGIRVLARVRPDHKLLEGLVRPVFGLLEGAPSAPRRGARRAQSH
jgi:hypothetical protein